jgi:hypothetical protein
LALLFLDGALESETGREEWILEIETVFFLQHHQPRIYHCMLHFAQLIVFVCGREEKRRNAESRARNAVRICTAFFVFSSSFDEKQMKTKKESTELQEDFPLFQF